jgi:hypothetical protein
MLHIHFLTQEDWLPIKRDNSYGESRCVVVVIWYRGSIPIACTRTAHMTYSGDVALTPQLQLYPSRCICHQADVARCTAQKPFLPTMPPPAVVGLRVRNTNTLASIKLQDRVSTFSQGESMLCCNTMCRAIPYGAPKTVCGTNLPYHATTACSVTIQLCTMTSGDSSFLQLHGSLLQHEIF